MSDEIERMRQYGRRWIPHKTGAGYWGMIQDAKLTKEHAYEMNKKNVCPSCHMVLTKRGKCPMGCND